jgi:hypothetical protein
VRHPLREHAGDVRQNYQTLNETNTAFSSPHGFMGLTTTTGSRAAGEHSLTFEIGDVNDHTLDSAVFISALQALQGDGGGDTPLTEELSSIPEPSTWGTMAMLTGAGLLMRRRKIILCSNPPRVLTTAPTKKILGAGCH